MSDEDTNQGTLLDRVAKQAGVAPELLERLTALELEIPDINVHGAKAELGRRVAAILDEEVQREQGL